MSKKKSQDDYDQLAAELKLEPLELAPQTVTTPIDWRCTLCGRIHRRSYNKLKYMTHGCRCQSQTSLKIEDYQRLAARLGLKWVGKNLPQTVYHPTSWTSLSGDLFDANYHELGYSLWAIPARFLPYFPPRIIKEIQQIKEDLREERQARYQARWGRLE